MAYQSLYRRYRSQNFSQIRGQGHIVRALQSAITEERQGHAYLFSGPRGTGKTSTARVLAKALNCNQLENGEPCTSCEDCFAIEEGRSFDLHELDAASHNKVDDIRDLVSKVHLGSPGRTKVYILDEVHMLSPGAENALLKTLEEPPDHVVFVLATTEPHKVVPTIRSRTQHFEFHLLPAEELEELVRFVITDAGLTVDENAIDYVLRQGGGSARDTLSALDLVAATGGSPEVSNVGAELAEAIGDGDTYAAISAIEKALTAGLEPRLIGERTVETFRYTFLSVMGGSLDQLGDRQRAEIEGLAQEFGPNTMTRSLGLLGQALIDIRQAPDPRVPLEVAVIKLCRKSGEDSDALLQRIEALEKQVSLLSSTGLASPEHVTAGPVAAEPVLNKTPAASMSPVAEKLVTETTGKKAARPTDVPPSPRSKRAAAAKASTAAATPTAAPVNRDVKPEPELTSGPSPESESESELGGPAGPMPSLMALNSELHRVLEIMNQGARVRFKAGEFIAVENQTARFGLPNPIHRDRCLEHQDGFSSALREHFKTQIVAEIVVFTSEDLPLSKPKEFEKRPSQPMAKQELPANEPTEDHGPIDQLEDATDAGVSGIDRLSEAFPGSSILESD